MKKFPLMTAMVFLGALGACTKKDSTGVPAAPTTHATLLTPGKMMEKSASSELPFKIYQFMSANPKDICLSPLSIEQTFGMVYLGTNGKTKSQVEELFGFKADEVPSLAEERLGKSVEFFWGNSVWYKSNKNLSPSFLERIKNELGAESHSTLDVTKINAWIAKSTHEKIQNLIKQLDLNTINVLINAFYLNAPWEHPFKKEDNLFGPFQSTPSMASQVIYLSQQRTLPYFEDAKSIWVELAYKDSGLSMVLALPKVKLDLRSVEDNLSMAYLRQVLDGFKDQSVDVKIPKFKIETSLSLSRLFQDMGYGDLFKAGDYSRMTILPGVKISEVLQATYLKVDEQGTEAAAAAAVIGAKGGSMMGTPKPFYANQPFFYLIRNKKTSRIYFLGRVFDPKF